MSATVVTKQGDTLDYLCWAHYGATAGRVVETVLAENEWLTDHGVVLPAGLYVHLPDIEAPAETRGIALWE